MRDKEINESREKLLREIQQDKNTLVDLKINKRQLELCVDAVHHYYYEQLKSAQQFDNDQLYDNVEQLKKLESYLWEIISELRGWKRN